MPPSNHSSSSRSSSSRSSSSRSSSSRGPSGHSASSHSSRPSGSRSAPSRSSPSPHSSSGFSVFSLPRKSPYGPAAQRPAQKPAPRRERVNQPTGYVSAAGARPKQIRGLRHEYVYYPAAWTDSATGTSYEKGYYDEAGQRYDDVSFVRDGKYENVLCHCPYCGQDAVLNLDADKVAAQTLQCPHCGAPMEIRSQLDEYISGATLTESSGPAENTSVYPPSSFVPTATKSKKRRGWIIAAAVAAALFLIGKLGSGGSRAPEPAAQEAPAQQVQLIQTAPDGETLYLVSSGGNGYAFTDTAGDADKRLVWDAAADSYYDTASDCWLWHNTDVTPPVWQYWYEGISSDFGDYGWMEHEADGWYIETSAGNWIALPSDYDADALWYLTGADG